MKDEDEISSPTCLFLLFLVWKMSAIGTLKKKDVVDVRDERDHSRCANVVKSFPIYTDVLDVFMNIQHLKQIS